MKRFNSEKDLKEFLEEKYLKYNNKNFIEFDPIKIPHSFTKKEDIEISAFLTSIISWGNRKMIIKNAEELMKAIIKLKPSSTKGAYIRSINMSSTMSPSISIEYKF